MAEGNKYMKLTDEQIINIVNKKGWFSVSWRYRDDYLRNQCKKLVLKGKIKWGKYEAGRDLFEPIKVS